MDDLVKRLREVKDWWREPGRTAEQAADRIEQLEAALQNYSCDCNLDDQDNCEVGCWDSASCGYSARAALGEKKDEAA